MSAVDHLFMALLVVVQPLVGAWGWRRHMRRIASGHDPDRFGQYRNTQVLEWSAFVALMALWLAFGRPLAELGILRPAGAGVLVGGGLLAVLVAWLWHSWRRARDASADERARLAAGLGDLAHFMPHTRREYGAFAALSVTAGIVEELVYRGYAFWYFGQFLPAWAVVVASAVGFGLAHSYQGLAGMLRVMLVGLAFGAFYLLTGSVWLPMLAHAALDILQGALLYEILRDRPGVDAPGEGQAAPIAEGR